MALYVDALVDYGDAARQRSLRHTTWCHLLADTEPELHAAAQQLGLRRAWYQHKGPDDPTWHYDITPPKRAQAIRTLGAVELDQAGVAELITRRRAQRSQPRPAADVVFLDWRDRCHYDHSGDRPCALCGRPTPLRSHDGEPAHKTEQTGPSPDQLPLPSVSTGPTIGTFINSSTGPVHIGTADMITTYQAQSTDDTA